MDREAALKSILRHRCERMVRDQREWEAREVRQYTALFLERQREEIDRGGLERERSWGSHLPPGLHQRYLLGLDGLLDLRMQCWAKLKARQYVRRMREWSHYR